MPMETREGVGMALGLFLATLSLLPYIWRNRGQARLARKVLRSARANLSEARELDAKTRQMQAHIRGLIAELRQISAQTNSQSRTNRNAVQQLSLEDFDGAPQGCPTNPENKHCPCHANFGKCCRCGAANQPQKGEPS